MAKHTDVIQEELISEKGGEGIYGREGFLLLSWKKNDILVKTKPLLEMVKKPWKDFLSNDIHSSEIDLLKKHERTGRPLGTDSFIEKMEFLLNRKLRLQKPGPKKRGIIK